jgi:uncharacterized tellurite resistance protein B-like protein
MATGLIDRLRSVFEGNPGIRKVAGDPALTAELLLLFRMILADGSVAESEMDEFRRICRDAFGIDDDSVDGVVEYLNDFGYETTAAQALAMFQELDLERRQLLARHLAAIAKADARLADNELQLLGRIIDILGVSPADIVEKGA